MTFKKLPSINVILFYLTLVTIHSAEAQEKPYSEQYRPQFHFSPSNNWCNDPNGLVYSKGIYHLFYQYNPFGNVWGHMTWAHSTSKDLLHWKQLPNAIKEEDGIMAFSGSCVIDKFNSSGFAKNKNSPMVAVYTAHQENVNQSQALAYSLDDGFTWTKYANNPVLDKHKKDFRDPKVSWYAKKRYWVMAVMMPNEHIVQFYNSTDLKSWKHLSDFGPAGDTAAVWECPDLMEVSVENSKQKKWVLQTSQNAGMQYFIGDFDGKTFTNETKAGILRPDYGSDYYAAVSYNNLPLNAQPISIGWLNNWNYANEIPTTPWKGAMSLPRNYRLKKIAGNLLLVQQPIDAVSSLRYDRQKIANISVTHSSRLPVKGEQFEIKFSVEPGASSAAGIRLASGGDDYFEVGYDNKTGKVYADRTHSSKSFKNKNFQQINRFEKVVTLNEKKIQFNIFYDHSIVEVFINGGETVFTCQIFPEKGQDGIEFFSHDKHSFFSDISFWKMRSVW